LLLLKSAVLVDVELLVDVSVLKLVLDEVVDVAL